MSERQSSDPLLRLAERALRGDERSERELLDHLAPRIRKFLSRILDPSDIDDALQETLMAILSALAEFRGDSSLTHFSIGIARNVALGRRLSRRRTTDRLAKMAQLELPLLEPVPSDVSLDRRRLGELEKLVARLPEAQARTLVLRVFCELSLAEVAEETRVSINTVRTRLRLARHWLRAWLGESDAT